MPLLKSKVGPSLALIQTSPTIAERSEENTIKKNNSVKHLNGPRQSKHVIFRSSIVVIALEDGAIYKDQMDGSVKPLRRAKKGTIIRTLN